jgi:hypothetical protein
MKKTTYTLGFVFARIFLQKKIVLDENKSITPISNTGSNGLISDIKTKLNEIGYPLSQNDYINFLQNFSNTGQTVLLEIKSQEADDFGNAIDNCEEEARRIINTISILSLNPPQLILGYGISNQGQNGVKFFMPKDRIIKHATNIPGYFDAVPDLIEKSMTDPKFALLLSLFKTSIEQTNWINKALYLLILFEEASDNESGNLEQRLLSHSNINGYFDDLNVIAVELGIEILEGKSVIDMLLKLRNSTAHNGTITPDTLREYKGEWIVPIIQQKDAFINLLIKSARYMILTLVGHHRDSKSIKISGTIELKYD